MQPHEFPSTPPLPALSPPFISADAAARWVQKKLSSPRQLVYGGVILKRGRRYFATTPIPGDASVMYHTRVLATNERGDFLHPPGYICVAFYSARAKSPDQPEMDEKIRRLIWSFFTDSELMFTFANRHFAPTHYLFGADGSLIRYTASDSEKERALDKKLHHGVPSQEPVYIEDEIGALADAGQLWVVIPNADWSGVVGQVLPGSGMRGHLSLSPATLIQPEFAPINEGATGALIQARNALGRQPDQRFSGVILRSEDKHDYVATLPVSDRGPSNSLSPPFPKDGSGRTVLPDGFRLDALYWIAGTTPRQGGEFWLTRAFFSLAELAQGLRMSRSRSAEQQPGEGLAMYLRTREGAVLRYRFSGTGAEAQQFNTLDSDSPLERIQKVAAVGELWVDSTGGPWDVAGRVDPFWQPYALYRIALSPAFVSADDAARHAHAQVGSRRSQEYAALILERPDGRFVVTRPQVSAKARFALNAVYPVDERGAPIVLEYGMRVHALFCSRARSTPSPRLRDVEAQIAVQMFTDRDLYQVLSNIEVVPRAYLSGAADCLLAYGSQRLASFAERELFERVTPESGSSQAARDLDQDLMLPSAFVREQAYPGRLHVLLANPLWGPVGPLPDDWEPASGADWSRLPEQPVLGPVFASAMDVVREAHGRIGDRYAGSAVGAGFILKHDSLPQYAATARVALGELDSLEQRCRNAAQLQALGFKIDSLFYSSTRKPDAGSAAGRWLGRHFISPADLQGVFHQHAGHGRFAPGQRSVLYIAALDGALLEYQAGNTEAFSPETAGQLDSAHLSVRDWVLRVAANRHLQVLIGSECWGTPGRVEPHWVPFGQITRRRLSPVFSNADDAARYVLKRLDTRHDKVYGGLILRSATGLFVATEPLELHVESFDPQWVRLSDLVDKGVFLGGSTVVACYHSRSLVDPGFSLEDPQRDLYQNMFSTQFIADRLKGPAERPVTDYLLCNDGALLRYRLGGGDQHSALAREFSANPFEPRLRAGVLTPQQWVERLANAGELEVLEGSRLWGTPGPVAGFVAYPEEQDPWLSGPTRADIGLSPLFAQPADAARYSLRWPAKPEHTSFGFILRCPGNGHYVATDPVRVWGARSLELGHVFAHGQLPQGYEVDSFYWRAPVTSMFPSFIPPQDLSLALGAANRLAGAPVIYLGCPDGALLLLNPSNPPVELRSPEAAAGYAKKLQEGSLPFRDYVRNVAGTRKLRVLHGSEVWRPGLVVDPQWEPGMTPSSTLWADTSRALGPLYLHTEDAARYAQDLVGPYTGDDYLGGILENVALRSCVAIEPLKDPGNEFSAERQLFWTASRADGSDLQPSVPSYPPGYRLSKVHQLYKSDFAHGPGPVTALDINFNSWGWVHYYTFGLQAFGLTVRSYYLSTRDGALLEYTPDYAVGSAQQDMRDQLEHMGRYRALDMLKIMAPYKVWSVLHSGNYWTRPGVVAEVPMDVPDSFHHEKDEL